MELSRTLGSVFIVGLLRVLVLCFYYIRTKVLTLPFLLNYDYGLSSSQTFLHRGKKVFDGCPVNNQKMAAYQYQHQ